MAKKVTLRTWAEQRFEKVPCSNTLRAWARDMKIYPFPEKVGREYLVLPDAIYIGNDHNKIAEYGSQATKPN